MNECDNREELERYTQALKRMSKESTSLAELWERSSPLERLDLAEKLRFLLTHHEESDTIEETLTKE